MCQIHEPAQYAGASVRVLLRVIVKKGPENPSAKSRTSAPSAAGRRAVAKPAGGKPHSGPTGRRNNLPARRLAEEAERPAAGRRITPCLTLSLTLTRTLTVIRTE